MTAPSTQRAPRLRTTPAGINCSNISAEADLVVREMAPYRGLLKPIAHKAEDRSAYRVLRSDDRAQQWCGLDTPTSRWDPAAWRSAPLRAVRSGRRLHCSQGRKSKVWQRVRGGSRAAQWRASVPPVASGTLPQGPRRPRAADRAVCDQSGVDVRDTTCDVLPGELGGDPLALQPDSLGPVLTPVPYIDDAGRERRAFTGLDEFVAQFRRQRLRDPSDAGRDDRDSRGLGLLRNDRGAFLQARRA